jgi:glucokinase-like ROK family protein
MMPRMKLSTADQAWVRKMNRAIVLETVRVNKTLSRAGLAGETGLNPSTVSSIIAELIEDNLIRETDLSQSGTGRPGRLLELNPSGGCAVGIEINVDFISVILADFAANILWRRSVDSSPEHGQDVILQHVGELIGEAAEIGSQRQLRLLGVGVGVPGLVDVHNGLLRVAPNLHWSNVPVRELLGQHFDCPIYVENEANAAALGEYYFGVARHVRSFIYLSVGIGLGSGIVIDGKLFRGRYGFAGEAGHMTLDINGELCACGKHGCLETFVNQRAVVQRVRRALAQAPDSELHAAVAGRLETLTYDDVVKTARSGDPVALAAIGEIGHYLGVGVANLVNLLNTELIVLGGSLSLADSMVLPEVQKVVNATVLTPSREHLQIISSALGVDACMLGSVALVLDEILREPDLV